MREKKKTRKKGADQQGKITAPKTTKVRKKSVRSYSILVCIRITSTVFWGMSHRAYVYLYW